VFDIYMTSMLFLCLVFTKSIFFCFRAFGKVDKLIELLNTKTGDLFEELSTDKISKFLARSSSTLFVNITGSFFSTTIEDICIDTNIVDPEKQDKIG
ncbi:unnamed protein product, partial [Rotaria sordida]